MKDNIVVLGGSFNPCTLAHQDTLLRAMKLIDAKLGIYLPTGNHYGKSELIDFDIRVHLLELMNTPKTYISLYENSCQTHPKTLQSLDYIQSCYPNATLYFIVGLDNLIDIPNWYMPEMLLSKHHLICTSRDFHKPKPILSQPFYQPYLSHIHILNTNPEMQAVSSSQVRSLIQNKKGEQCSSLLHPDVYQYIMKHHLYI